MECRGHSRAATWPAPQRRSNPYNKTPEKAETSAFYGVLNHIKLINSSAVMLPI